MVCFLRVFFGSFVWEMARLCGLVAGEKHEKRGWLPDLDHAGVDQPADRLEHRLEGAVARAEVEKPRGP
jgi:hypothetical protein